MSLPDIDNFLQSPEPKHDTCIRALWLDGKGQWDEAHRLVQDVETREAAHIHAYLHRKEGDNGNAAYWYSRARAPYPNVSLQEEWEQLITRFLLG